MKKLDGLQVLRGIAAILVVLYHATIHYREQHVTFLADMYFFGYAGVDVFFVLSGFIIMYSSQKYVSKVYRPVDFIKKRMIRIYPSYWLFLFIPITLLFLVRPQLVPHSEVFNLTTIWQVIFLTFEHPEISQITWTLSFELYFYALFFLVVFHRKWIWLLILIGTMSIIDLCIGLDFLHNAVLADMFSKLNLEFLMGICAYWLLMHYQPKAWVVWLLILGGTGLFLFSGLFLEREYHDLVKVYRPISYGIPATMIILGFAYREYHGNVYFHNFLKQAGDASYVLYLIHSPLISFVDNFMIFDHHLIVITPQVTTLLSALGIVLLSIFLHQKIERPLITGCNHLITHRTKIGKA